MPSVRVKDGENFEGALRRFKRAVEKAGTHRESRRREFFEKPSVKKKRNLAAARKRLLKRLARERQLLMQSLREKRR